VLIEACIDSLADARAAARAGVGRLELCANLLEGGTTPSTGLVRAIIAHVDIPLFVMVRPRGGDFVYDADDIEVMLRDIEETRTAGARGIVGGALNPDGSIDEDATAALIEAAAPLPFTFHRAFDLTRHLDEALDVLLALGAHRVLSSGGAATAIEGAEALRRLRERARGRLELVAGGGVRAAHIAQLARHTGITEFHVGARRHVASAMRHRAGHARIAKPATTSDDAWQEADAAELGACVTALSLPSTVPAAR
jgi:copper homeostasis protein